MSAHPVGIGPIGRLVAANLKAMREARKLPQRDLSALLAKLGHPMLASAISKIESGQRRVDADDLSALAAALDVEPWSLAQPIACDTCKGCPPVGFTCNACLRMGTK